MPAFKHWKVNTGSPTYDDTLGEWTLPPTSGIISPFIDVRDILNWRFYADMWTNTASTQFTPLGGVLLGSAHYAADKITPANNSAGFASNGNAQSIALNTVPYLRKTWLNTAGGAVVYIRITISNATPYVAGTLKVQNPDLYNSPTGEFSTTHLENAHANWSIDLLSLDGVTQQVAAAPFKSARCTWAADGPGAVEINLRDKDVTSGQWLHGQRRVLVRKGNHDKVYQGWLNRLERAGPPGAKEYRAASLGLASILDRRVVHGDFSIVETIATTAAWNILQHLNAQTFDKTGFTQGTTTGLSRSVTRHYCDGDVASSIIQELAETQDGGFAWEINENGKLDTWVGGRGTDLSATVTLRESDVNDWTFVGDTSEIATFATGLGETDDDNPCGPPLIVTWNNERSTYGRLESVVESDRMKEDDMLGAADEDLRARIASRDNLKVSWIEGRGPWDFEAVWIGDVVNVERGAAFGGDADMRCISVSITLEPGTNEFVEMEFEAA